MSKEEMVRKAINELDYVENNLAYDELPNIRKALDYLDQIGSVESSEVMEAFERILRTHRKIYGEWTPKVEDMLKWEGLECKEIDIIKSYIQQAEQRERGYEELDNSDTSKEKSSIKYYNETKDCKRRYEELKIAYDKDTLELTDELNVLRSKLKRYFELKKDNPYLTQKENKEYIKLSRDLKKEGDFWKVGESDE